MRIAIRPFVPIDAEYEAMVGINVSDLPAPHRLAERGW